MDTLRILKVLADETRLRILKLIREEGLCVCEIQGALDLNQSNTSRHLARLNDAGLVLQSKSGQWINYAANKTVIALHPFIDSLLNEALVSDEVFIEAERRVSKYSQCGNPCTSMEKTMKEVG